jgi:hypothetical protein
VYDDIDELIGELKPLTVPDAEPAGHPLNLSDVATFEDAEWQIGAYFGTHPEVHEVDLAITGRRAGVVSRKSLLRDADLYAGDSPATQVGVGEGMQLPGFSTRYRLLEFKCLHGCPSEHRIHYDERYIPYCAKHGPMELQP